MLRGTATPDTPSGYGPAEVEAIQRRTVRVLLTSQAAGGVGLVATYIVTALLAKDLTGSTAAGHGGRLVPVHRCRRGVLPPGQAHEQSGSAGRAAHRLPDRGGAGRASPCSAPSPARSPCCAWACSAPGAGNAANLATRYAASDLAVGGPAGSHHQLHRVGHGHRVDHRLGRLRPGQRCGRVPGPARPRAARSSCRALMFLVAAAIVELLLRPDPLVVAGGMGRRSTTPTGPAPASRWASSGPTPPPVWPWPP